MNNEFKCTQREAVGTDITWHFPDGTEKNHEKRRLAGLRAQIFNSCVMLMTSTYRTGVLITCSLITNFGSFDWTAWGHPTRKLRYAWGRSRHGGRKGQSMTKSLINLTRINDTGAIYGQTSSQLSIIPVPRGRLTGQPSSSFYFSALV
jgi:hypothetical protein